MILTLALDGFSGDTPVPVLLDIDAFTQSEFEPTDQQVWTVLEQLRVLKNRAFFGTITEKAAELYE